MDIPNTDPDRISTDWLQWGHLENFELVDYGLVKNNAFINAF